ncbi:unnamed protein product [Trichobilharzia szidati]|nr:unnamed protein product [Trichobilharzia szidati]
MTEKNSWSYVRNNNLNVTEWMSELPAQITCQKINTLAIPGTHNSGTYSLNTLSSVSPDSPLYFLKKFLPACFLSRITYPWCKTQSLSITAQLKLGIRYFDLRICNMIKNTKSKSLKLTEEFYIVHGQYAQPLANELKRINEFIKAHPNEVILLDCNHIYCFQTDEQREKFEKLVLSIIGPIMLPRNQEIPSLDDIWDTDYRILCFSCHNPILDKMHLNFWSIDKMKSFWAETSNPKILISFLNNHLGPSYHKDPLKFHVYQSVLTANSFFILLHPFGSVRKTAKCVTPYAKRWINSPDHQANINGVNIVIIDFCSVFYPEYCEDIIKLNYKTWPN